MPAKKWDPVSAPSIIYLLWNEEHGLVIIVKDSGVRQCAFGAFELSREFLGWRRALMVRWRCSLLFLDALTYCNLCLF